MTALAVMVALVGAMFAAYAPVGANHNADKLGNVSHNIVLCTTSAVLMGDANADGLGDGPYDVPAMVWVEDRGDPAGAGEVPAVPANDTNDDPDEVPLTTDLCVAADGGATPPVEALNVGAYFSVTPNGTDKPIITKLNPTLGITLDDSDGVVAAGGRDLKVTIKVSTLDAGTPDADDAVNIEWVRVSGELDNPTPTDETLAGLGAKTPSGASTTANIEIPEGTTEREYTVSVRVSYDHDGDDADEDDPAADPPETAPKTLTKSAKFTVGDPGTNAAAATLSLGNSHDEDPRTSLSDVIPEDGVEAAGDDIWLTLTVTNSDGEKANSAGLNSVTVIGPGATLSIYAKKSDTAALDSDDNSATATTANQTMHVKVEKAGNPPKPGTVTVYAIVIGDDGAPRSADIDVIFTGSAASVVLGDDISVGKPAEGEQAQAEISLGASDSGGNKATLGNVIYAVKDADGNQVSQAKVKAETSTAGSSTERKTDDNSTVDVVLVTVDDSADAGVYTIEASLNGVDDSTDTATVTVSGAAANVDLSASSTSSDTIGDIITVTATVTDEDGHNIADGQLVTFDVSGDGLVQIGSDASTGTDGMAGFQAKTKNGSASGLFTVTGEGTAVVSAVIGNQTAVVVIVSTAGSSAAADEEASVACLSNLQGFATWTCGVESS
ncbi:MAG: hypothetical protein OXC29_12260, partial [Rhodococcus sp.]|nr:hypothetical protein [Rhodococcus sp. (in: high G+C Gram-positive bacteria)]